MKRFTLLFSILVFAAQVFAQVPSNYKVATWSGFRTSAATFTFDDGCDNQFTNAVPLFDKNNYTASFYPVINWGPNWTTLSGLVAKGHEIGSHSVSHPEGALSESEMSSSKTTIEQNVTGQKCLTITYPNCVVPNESTCEKYYIGGRICGGQINPKSPSNYNRIDAIICGSNGSCNTTANFKTQLTSAVNQQGWAVFLIHEVDNGSGYSPLSSTVIDEVLTYIKENDSKIWVATFRDAILYAKERDNLKLVETTQGDALSLAASVTISSTLTNYDYPITVRRELPSGWENFAASTNSADIPVKIVTVSGTKYAEFDVVPGKTYTLENRESDQASIGGSTGSGATGTTEMLNGSWELQKASGDADGTATPNGKSVELCATTLASEPANWHLQYFQALSNLQANVEYTLSFKAKAAANRSISVMFQQNEGDYNVYGGANFTIDLTTTEQEFTQTFTITDEVLENSKVAFMFGNELGCVTISDISLTYEKPIEYLDLIQNGSFADESSWELQQNENAEATATVSGGKVELCPTTLNASPNGWHLQYYQPLDFETNVEYTLSFNAQAATARTLDVWVQQIADPYATYQSYTFDLTTTEQTFTETFTLAEVDEAKLTFVFGDANGCITISDVSLTYQKSEDTGGNGGSGGGGGSASVESGIVIFDNFDQYLVDKAYIGPSGDGPVNNIGAYYTGKYTNLFAKHLGKTQAQTQQKLDAAWNHFFRGNENQKVYYEVGSDMAYIYDTGSGDVRTEGMSYGMMICVQLDHQTEFDKLWRWAKTYMQYPNGNQRAGLFAWQCETNGTIKGASCAPDGEAYFLTALFFASHRWGNNGSINYEQEAQYLIDKIMDKPGRAGGQVSPIFNLSNYLITFGETSYQFTDPSYNLPGFLELWAKWTDTRKDFWAKTPDAARNLLYNSAHKSTGLYPDYSNFDGSGYRPDWASYNTAIYMYDAIRCPMNVGMDYHWFGHDATRQRTMCSNILNFFKKDNYTHAYFNLDGSNPSDSYSVGMTGANCVGAFALGDTEGALAETQAQKLWNAYLPTGQWRYYGGMVYFLSLLHASGEFKIYKPVPEVIAVNLTGAAPQEWEGMEFSEDSTFFAAKGDKVYNVTVTIEEPTIQTYVVTFLNKAGNELDAQTITAGENATAPTAPEVEGFDFVEWDTDFTNIQSNLTVKPIYAKKTFTITYEPTDGISFEGNTTVEYADNVAFTVSVVDENLDETTLEVSYNDGSQSIVLTAVAGTYTIPAVKSNITISTTISEKSDEFVFGETVINNMITKHGVNSHPRIIMTTERFAELKTHINDGSVTAKALNNLRGQAYTVLNEPVQEYVLEGVRLLEASKRITRRIIYTAMAYNIFGNEEYAERCWAELEAASKFPDWNPKHFLDPSEMILGFAFGYDWLYNWMTPEQREIVKTAMVEKGLNMAMDDFENKTTSNSSDPKYRTYKWYQDIPGSNWKMVCDGGMAIASLAIGDESDVKNLAAKVLTYTYDDAYAFIRRVYSDLDGSYSESLSYWEYATYHLGMYASSLISATGTDYDLADFSGLQKSADYVRYMCSNTYKSFNYGNEWGDSNKDWRIPLFLWFGEYFKSYEISALRVEKIAEGGESFMDLLWLDEEKMSVPTENIATDWGVVNAPNASFRNTLDESGIVAAFHVGENNYKYTWHYDLGIFFIESEGERFFTDLGPENYDIPNHQYSYRMRAEGHNTLVINPSEDLDQKDGITCLINRFESGDEAFAVSDLTAAYEPSGAESVVRGLKMIKDKKCVVIQDEITLTEPGEIYWFAHTQAQINVAGDGKSAVLTLNGKKLWVGITSENGSFSIMNAELLPTSRPVANQTDNSAFKKLAIHLTNTESTTISVACIPLKSDETQPSWTPTLRTISEWGTAFVENADYSILNAYITAASLLTDGSIYTTESWNTLQSALTTAQNIDKNLTIDDQIIIDNAANALNSAMNNLTLKDKANYTNLNNAITAAEMLNEDDFTTESWSALQSALTAANAVDKNLYTEDQAIIDNATSALVIAMNGLAVKTFTVTFKNGSETLKTETVEKGGNATAPTAPQKDGFEFAGWEGSFTNVQADVTITATFIEKGKANYTNLNNAITAAEMLNKDDFTTESWSALQSALTAANAVDKNLYTENQAIIDNATSALVIAMNGLAVKTFTVTFKNGSETLKTETVEKGGNATAPTAPQKDGFEFAGWEGSFTNVQADVTITATFIEKGKANYVALNNAITAAEMLNEDDFTTESWSALQSALTAANAVDKNLYAENQAIIDNATSALVIAMNGLESSAADYSTLQNAIVAASVFTDEDKYTIATWTTFQSALTAAKNVDKNLHIKDQKIIDDAASTLVNAISNLKTLANYSALDNAISATNLLVENNYTPESWSALQSALTAANAVDRDLDSFSQSVIDNATTTLQNAISNLEAKQEKIPADYSILDKNITAASAITDKDKYTATTWAALQSALTAANAVDKNLFAEDQAIIDNAANALESAMLNLALQTFTVTFKAGNVIVKTEVVQPGGSATAPSATDIPTQAGKEFTGWVGSYTNVTADVVIIAQYQEKGKANYLELDNQISRVNALNEADYSRSSWSAMQSKLSVANTIDRNLLESQQSDVDNVTNNLSEAINQLVALNRGDLQTAINEAKDLANNASIGYGKNQYPANAKDVLLNAIISAEIAFGKTSTEQNDIDQAETTLRKAMAAFESAKILTDMRELATTISQANSAISKADFNTGNDAGQYPESAVNALREAITHAQSIYETAKDQNVVDAEVQALLQAITEFNASQVASQVDVTALQKLIDKATDLILNSSVGTAVGQYPQTEFSNLTTARQNARNVLNATSQTLIDNQVALLEDAIIAFIASKITDQGGNVADFDISDVETIIYTQGNFVVVKDATCQFVQIVEVATGRTIQQPVTNSIMKYYVKNLGVYTIIAGEKTQQVIIK